MLSTSELLGSARTNEPWRAIPWVIALLVISAVSLGVGPLLMPATYSWIANTTSESGAQGVEDPWVARLGFLAFGLAVLWLAVR